MLFLIHGTDTKKTRGKLNIMIESLQKKRPDASLVRFNAESWSQLDFEEILYGASLFVPKNIIVLDGLFVDKVVKEYLTDRLAELASSEHVCFVLEGKLDKETLKKFGKKSEKIEEHNLVVGVVGGAQGVGRDKKDTPETFAFADAILSRDKKRSWVIFQHLLTDEMVAEEIHGVLWWQFKSVYLASKFSNAKEAGLNPYVFSKCQGFLKKWSAPELEGAMDRLIDMYHKAHKGEVDFMSEIEVLCFK